MSLQKGLEVVKKATEYDSQGNFKDAVFLYELALQHFEKALIGKPSEHLL